MVVRVGLCSSFHNLFPRDQECSHSITTQAGYFLILVFIIFFFPVLRDANFPGVEWLESWCPWNCCLNAQPLEEIFVGPKEFSFISVNSFLINDVKLPRMGRLVFSNYSIKWNLFTINYKTQTINGVFYCVIIFVHCFCCRGGCWAVDNRSSGRSSNTQNSSGPAVNHTGQTIQMICDMWTICPIEAARRSRYENASGTSVHIFGHKVQIQYLFDEVSNEFYRQHRFSFHINEYVCVANVAIRINFWRNDLVVHRLRHSSIYIFVSTVAIIHNLYCCS